MLPTTEVATVRLAAIETVLHFDDAPEEARDALLERRDRLREFLSIQLRHMSGDNH